MCMLEVGQFSLIDEVISIEIRYVIHKPEGCCAASWYHQIQNGDDQGLKIAMTHFWQKGQRAGTNHLQETPYVL